MKFFVLLASLTAGLFAHPYIYLSTPSIYTPGSAAEIRLEASGTEEVYMRLYEIDDPIGFFSNQKNLRSPRVGSKVKPANFFMMIEGLADRTKHNTRYLARELMSEESRISFRDFLGLPRLEKYDVDSGAAKPERLGKNSIPPLKGYSLIREWKVKFEKKKKTDEDYYYYDPSYRYKDVELDLSESGVYLVEAYYGNRVAYTPVIVSEMSIIAKQDPKNVYVFAVNSANGKPRRGVKVQVLSDTNRVASGRTNGKGIFHTSFDTTHLRVLAQDGKDFAVVDNYYYYDYDFEGGSAPGKSNNFLYLHTERPIYRPDQTVYFKGILRMKNNGSYQMPQQKDAEVVVTDPEGNEIYRRTLKTDSWGAISDSLIVPSSGRLGRYTLSAMVDSVYHSVQFRVEEYRKPEFKVQVETDREAYVQGDEVRVKVAADYFFGAPVAGAEVKLRIYRVEYYDWYWYGSEYIDELTSETDEQGKATFRYRTPEDGQNYRYTFEVQVRDESRKQESGEAYAFVAQSGILIDIMPSKYVVEPGEKLGVTIKTRDIMNKPVQGVVDVEIYRNYWDKDDKLVSRRTISVGPLGSSSFDFVPKEAGSYYVRATAEDERGNQSSEERWLWVSSYGSSYSWNTDEMQIVFDKETYEPGDRAEVLIIAPYNDVHILASIEADRIYKVDVVELKGNTALLKFKVQKEFVPNAFLSISGVSDGEFFRQEKEFKIERKNELLSVRITPDKNRYEPGEKGKLDILVKDSKGKPVKADLSLAVVDEALYSLAEEIAPPIEDYFYGQRYNQVSTNSSVYFSFYGYEDEYSKLEGAARDSVVLAAYKGREEPQVRQRFEDMAYWNAFVRTDGQGRASVSFTYPENLTTWRATARAITTDTKVGESREKTLVTKDLLVRIMSPRFITERDSLVIPTIVHNYTRETQEVECSFTASGLELLDRTKHVETIGPGASARIDWPVRATSAGDATLVAKAIATDFSDAMQIKLPVNPHGMERNMVLSAFMPGADERATRSFNIPDGTDMKTLSASLTLTPTIGSALFAGLAYLAGYPYGCAEQTMSSFFPDLIVADLIKDPKRGNPKLAEELPKMIEKGLAKLYGYQHSDGGWGWWENDETMNYMTAYVMHGLIYASELGYDINPKVIERGTQSLKNLLSAKQDIKLVERAYMVYVLALAPGDNASVVRKELAAIEKKELDSYSKALVALTWQRIGDNSKARAVLESLKKDAISDGEMVYWSGTTRGVEYWGDDPVEVTATTLRAFLAISPKDNVIPKIVYWLLRERRGNHWKSTKDSALSLLAIAEFLKISSDASPNIEIEFTLNGRKLESYSVSEKDLLEFSSPMRLRLSGVNKGDNTLKVHKKGQGNLFFSMVLSFYSEEEGVPEGGGELKVHRKYYKLIPRVENDQLVYYKEELKGPIRIGEPLFVKLYVDCENELEYVMLTDPIPAGFDVAKERDRFPVRDERFWGGYYDYDDEWGYMYSGREIHDDHVAFFMSYLWSGKRELSYVLEPYLPGSYHVMPAKISLMYYPDKWGNSSESVITVEE